MLMAPVPFLRCLKLLSDAVAEVEDVGLSQMKCMLCLVIFFPLAGRHTLLEHSSPSCWLQALLLQKCSSALQLIPYP